MATHFDNELCFRYRFFRAMQASVFCRRGRASDSKSDRGDGKLVRRVSSAVRPDGRTNIHFHSGLACSWLGLQ